jgi:hypothetical protein
MKPKTIDEMQFFVGKVCTIFIPPTNRQFDEDTARQHYVIRIKQITSDGIWGENLFTHTLAFFAMEHVISIQQELELDPKNPEHVKIIEKHMPPEEAKAVVGTAAGAIDVDELKKLAEESKHGYDSIVAE